MSLLESRKEKNLQKNVSLKNEKLLRIGISVDVTMQDRPEFELASALILTGAAAVATMASLIFFGSFSLGMGGMVVSR